MPLHSLRTARPAVLAALIAGLILSAGCGGTSKTSVKGKVTYAGKPLAWGMVTLVSADGATAAGFIDHDGNYSVDGVPTGPVKIGVDSPDPAQESRSASRGGDAGKDKKDSLGIEDPRAHLKQDLPPDRPKPPPGKWFPIPEKFADPNSSGLTGTVESGKPLNIDLK